MTEGTSSSLDESHALHHFKVFWLDNHIGFGKEGWPAADCLARDEMQSNQFSAATSTSSKAMISVIMHIPGTDEDANTS